MRSKRLHRLYAGQDGLGLKVGDLMGELKESGQFKLWAFNNVEIEQAAVRLMLLPDDFPLLRDKTIFWGTVGELRAKMAEFAIHYQEAVTVVSPNGHFPGADDDLNDGLFPLGREATGGLTVYRRVGAADGALTDRWLIIGMTTESGIWHPCRDWDKEYDLVCDPDVLATVIQRERQCVTIARDEAGQITEIGTEVDVTNGRAAYWANKKST